MKVRWHRIFMTVVGLVVAVVASPSAAVREVTLQQALNLALQHSHDLKAAQAHSKAYQATLGSARSARWPTASVTATAFYKTEVPSFDLTLPIINQTMRREIGTKENYQTDVRLTLPLFSGGRIGGQIEAAGAAADLYHALETSSRDQLYYQTRVEYLSLSRAERIVEATRASLQRATVIMKDVGSLMAAGAADSVDRLEAELAMTEANLKVQEALTLRRSAEIRLAILLGLPADDSLALTDSLPAPQIPLPRQDSIERAELRAAAASVSLSASQVRLARSAYYPIIAFFGGYSYGKPNLDLFNKNWMDYFIVGASMTWSFDIGRREHYQVLHAKGLRTAAREEREDLTERFGREARLAYEGLTLAYEKYLTAGRRHDMASDNFRLAEQKHREGVLSSNRLLQIETSFSEAEAGLAVALADYHLAQSAYYFAAGSDKLQKGF